MSRWRLPPRDPRATTTACTLFCTRRMGIAESGRVDRPPRAACHPPRIAPIRPLFILSCAPVFHRRARIAYELLTMLGDELRPPCQPVSAGVRCRWWSRRASSSTSTDRTRCGHDEVPSTSVSLSPAHGVRSTPFLRPETPQANSTLRGQCTCATASGTRSTSS